MRNGKKVKVIFCFFLENFQWKYFHFFAFSLSFRNEVMNPPRPQPTGTDTDADTDTIVSLALCL